MVHFFGILSPDFGKRTAAPDAPNKTGFFGGVPDFTPGSVPMSRAEQDACYLAGKAPEPHVDGDVSIARYGRFSRRP
ncbi:MAG: hypothetical protein WBA73_02155 [Devosia sp.]